MACCEIFESSVHACSETKISEIVTGTCAADNRSKSSKAFQDVNIFILEDFLGVFHVIFFAIRWHLVIWYPNAGPCSTRGSCS